MFAGLAGGFRSSRLRRDERAQVADGASLLPRVIGNLNRESLLERTLQFDHTKAVDADVFAEAACVRDVVYTRAGYRAERLYQCIIAGTDLTASRRMRVRARRYLATLHLAGGGARKVGIGPEQPAAYLLVVGERCVCRCHCGFCHRCIRHLQRGCRLGTAAAVEGESARIAHTGLVCECSFQILRMHVEPCRSDDEIALAPGEDELTLGIACGEIAGMQPAFVRVARLRLSCTPLGVRDGVAADEDLSVLGDA